MPGHANVQYRVKERCLTPSGVRFCLAEHFQTRNAMHIMLSAQVVCRESFSAGKASLHLGQQHSARCSHQHNRQPPPACATWAPADSVWIETSAQVLPSFRTLLALCCTDSLLHIMHGSRQFLPQHWKVASQPSSFSNHSRRLQMTGRALESLQQSWSTAMGCSWASMCVHTLLFHVQPSGKDRRSDSLHRQDTSSSCIKGGP